ncbi:hypothetical protein [Streptomyces sp. NPDC007355]|uniref:hypothetical protein n=1 Tax=Streptomyces sp. NPDC007355 TaxID=3364778 RepID=UPI003698C967
MTKTKEHAEDTCPLVYQCRLPLSTRTVNHLAELLRRRLKATRSRPRILPPGKIAVIVLAVLRHDQRLADMAGGNHVSESTVRRWRDELIGLLAAQAPRLDRALKPSGRVLHSEPGQVLIAHSRLRRGGVSLSQRAAQQVQGQGRSPPAKQPVRTVVSPATVRVA